MPGATSPLGFPYPISSDTVEDALSTIPQQMAEAIDDYLASLAAVAAVAWTTPTYTAGWADVAGESTQYARSAGVVTVTLSAEKATIGVNEVIFTLPAGFRPSRRIRAVGQYGGVIRPFSVMSTGDVRSDIATTNGIHGTVSFQV